MRFIIGLLICFLSSSAMAKTPLSKSHIAEVERYLNGLSTFVADFTQTTQDGAISSGRFYLSRPGKLRWEYDPPHPILIIANGSLLTYHDKQLEQTSHIPIGSNLGGFLTRKHISFSKGVEIIDSYVEQGRFYIELVQEGKPLEGSLTLVVEKSPLSLKEIRVLDAIGKTTLVEFERLRYGQQLSKSLFILPKKWRKN
jgi:outer membrane lipoprotein-sorting protein